MYHKNLTNPIYRRLSNLHTNTNTNCRRETTHLASILQSCSQPSALPVGRQAHAQVVVNGLNNVGFLGSKVLGMYVLCSSFADSRHMFFQLDLWYASPWNWMIRGFTMLGMFDHALMFYFKMLGHGTSPDKYTFPYVIKSCGASKAVDLGRLVHETIRIMGFEVDAFVGSSLIKFYAENGCVADARYLFDKIPHRDCVLWNVMLNCYVKCGDACNSLWVFTEMRNAEIKPNSVTYASVLSVCASAGLAGFGSQLHGLVNKCGLEMDSTVSNSLLSVYAKCRRFACAHQFFSTIPKTDAVTWNVMVAGYIQNGLVCEALDLFNAMIDSGVRPDSVTFASLLPAITGSANLRRGKEIYGYIVRHGVPLDVFLKSALIDVFFKCRDVEMACKVFDQSAAVDVVVYSAMISGYVLNGMNKDALMVFRMLLRGKIRPNSVTLASVLPACAGSGALHLGKELHCNILKNGQDVKCYVGSAITDMYAKCGRLDLARRFFARMPEKDAICWNAMITSCAQNSEPEEAIRYFRQMGAEGKLYDCVSLSATLSACANLPALCYGKEIHGFMVRAEFRSDPFAESALIDMYAKCGSLESARHIFNMMNGKNEVSWNSIISAYGSHGCLKECLLLFHDMLAKGLQPDHITFLGIISACSHAGRVDEGVRYFNSMTQDYGITAKMEHYACMVDLYGRSGRLTEAVEVIKSMPFNPDAGIWGALLGASRVHGNVKLAELASGHLFNMEPQNSGYYVLLANMHADVGRWETVRKIRLLMKQRRVQKIPGYSWIEFNNTTHLFVAADKTHPDSHQIYLVLESLLQDLRKEGYVPQPQLYLPTRCDEQTMGVC